MPRKSRPRSTSASLSGPRSPPKVWASHAPASTRDQHSPAAVAPSSRSTVAAPASKRMPSRNDSPRVSVARRTWSQWSRSSRRRSRSSSTHWPRTRTSPSAEARSARSSAGDSFSSPSVTSTEKSRRASTPSTSGLLSPTRTLTSGRGGRRACHQSGTRTTSPAASKAGSSRRKRWASAGGAGAQPLADSSPVAADLLGEGAADLHPARGDPVGTDILATRHGGDGAGQPGALVRRAVDLDALAPLLQVGRRAEPGGEGAAKVAQKGQGRGQRRFELGGAQIEQAMAWPAPEGGGDAGPGSGGQAVAGLVGVCTGRIDEQRARRSDSHTEPCPALGRRRRAHQACRRGNHSTATRPASASGPNSGSPVITTPPWSCAATTAKASAYEIGKRALM